MTVYTTQERPGTLIVFEGYDGSGKSTQVQILKNLLESNGFFVHISPWNSSPFVASLTKKLKKNEKHLNPAVFDMMHAADLMDRYIRDIQSKLDAGMIVICDRYIHTAIAR